MSVIFLRFQVIPVSMYGVFFAVKELTLSGNPFHCNCRLRWLREFFSIISDRKHDLEAIECASPRSRRFEQIELHEFRCAAPSEPDIVFKEIDIYRLVYKHNITKSSNCLLDFVMLCAEAALRGELNLILYFVFLRKTF